MSNYMELMSSPGSWKEDFKHENGKYSCICVFCRQEFLGHKRRVVCKVCQDKQDARWKAELNAAFEAGGQYYTMRDHPSVKSPVPDFEQWFEVIYRPSKPKPEDGEIDEMYYIK